MGDPLQHVAKKGKHGKNYNQKIKIHSCTGNIHVLFQQ